MKSQLPSQHPARGSSAFASIHCIGVSYHAAPADLREALTFPQAGIPAALSAADREAGLRRIVILSTCHRTEIYADFSGERGGGGMLAERSHARERLAAWLAASRGVDRELLDGCAYSMHGEDAARHLLRVTSGLESMVPGEAQIISQVATALARSVAAHAASPDLKKLFRSAIRAGERARSRVWSRLRAADLGAAATAAVAHRLGQRGLSLADSRVAVFGAGELGALAIAALSEAGARRVVIVNRTLERAVSAAGRYHAEPRQLESLPEVLGEMDAAIFAVGAAGSLIATSDLRAVMQKRSFRPLVIVDVALPRNVEPGAAEISGVHLMGIDDIRPLAEGLYADRATVFPEVESILAKEMAGLTAFDPAAAEWPVPIAASA